MDEHSYYLGVDIGGTKSHALISDEEGQAVGFGEGGPGNHEGVGYDGLIATLNDVVIKALKQAGLDRSQINGAGFGVAGYDWPTERKPTLEAIATLGINCPIEAVNDTIIGLLAGASQGWGVAIVGGTGCNCWGWDKERNIGHLTGMGGLFGEYGSGGDIVHWAIHALAFEWSRRGPATKLTPAILTHTGASDLDDFLEGITMGKYRLGSRAAPLIFRIAHEGDPVAQDILRRAGRELGKLGTTVIKYLGIQDMEFDVVLVGSLFKASPLLFDATQETIHTLSPRAILTPLVVPPVVGGVLLGMDQSGIQSTLCRECLISSTQLLFS